MKYYNQTSTDFFLLGLFPPTRFGLFLFTLIILIFLIALIGNLSMILLNFLDTHLHTLIYFLLSQLSLMDLNYISTIVPKMAFNFLIGNKCIFFIGCAVQCFFFLTLAVAEALLLKSVTYDRYVAICFPLHYSIHMSKHSCVFMITGTWIMGSIKACAHPAYALHIPYCHSRDINHFFCDVPAMLTLACMDTSVYEYTKFVTTTLFLVFPFIIIACSHGWVLLAIHHMPSVEGRKKAYSTCSTHLTVVTFYYAPFAYTYLCPRSIRSPTEDKFLAVFYTIFIPILKPIVYSLRNKDVMQALKRVTKMICSVKRQTKFLQGAGA